MSFHRRKVRDRLAALEICYPQPVRRSCYEHSLDEVLPPFLKFIGNNGRDVGFPTSDSTNAKVGHEPLRRATSEVGALSLESGPELSEAID